MSELIFASRRVFCAGLPRAKGWAWASRLMVRPQGFKYTTTGPGRAQSDGQLVAEFSKFHAV